MGRMWTYFPTQLRVGIVTKEAIASPKQCHGAMCHSTDPVIRAPRAPLKCPTAYWVYFSIPNMV